MNMKEILKKCKLTDKELKIFFDKIKNVDHQEDHSRAYRTLMNPIRRDILQFIACEVRTREQIKEHLKLEDEQLIYHLTMLDQLFFVMNTETGWKATPRGIGFLENTQL